MGGRFRDSTCMPNVLADPKEFYRTHVVESPLNLAMTKAQTYAQPSVVQVLANMGWYKLRMLWDPMLNVGCGVCSDVCRMSVAVSVHAPLSENLAAHAYHRQAWIDRGEVMS